MGPQVDEYLKKYSDPELQGATPLILDNVLSSFVEEVQRYLEDIPTFFFLKEDSPPGPIQGPAEEDGPSILNPYDPEWFVPINWMRGRELLPVFQARYEALRNIPQLPQISTLFDRDVTEDAFGIPTEVLREERL